MYNLAQGPSESNDIASNQPNSTLELNKNLIFQEADHFLSQ